MPLDPNIILGYKPPQFDMAQFSPVNALSSAMKIKQYDQEGQLNAMKMRELESTAADRTAMRGLDPSSPTYLNDLSKIDPKLGATVRTQQATAGAQAASQKKSEIGSAGEKQQQLSQAYRDISANPSDAQITAHLEDVLDSPLYDDNEKRSIKNRADSLLAMTLEERKLFLAQQGSSASNLKPAAPAAPPASVAEYNFAKTPDGGGFVGSYQEFVTARAKAGRAPVQPRAEPLPRTQQVRLDDGTLGIVNMDTGKITPSTIDGKVVKGKLSAAAEKVVLQQKQLSKDIPRVVAELEDAIKPGGLLDQSTGSGAGRGVDVAAGFFGKATPGAIAVGQLQPIADMVLKMVPRFEGPQSDKDVLSYRQAAGQLSEPTLPIAIRKAAAKTIIKLMNERKNQFSMEGMEPTAESGAGGGANVIDFGSLK